MALALQKAEDVSARSALAAKSAASEALEKATGSQSRQELSSQRQARAAAMSAKISALNEALMRASSTVLEQQEVLNVQSSLLVGEVENI